MEMPKAIEMEHLFHITKNESPILNSRIFSLSI
ncbi:hypothetical protein G9C98_001159 [Cotesia typhae]|uniref:Uncharacterized protein n=1 Tax=Cotesia typhae TaxID=2053667 RepID=A0A8J5R6T4_9HYME|nr:hypothetical protein G9C98_001159 [Cotesia typhae]